jgi:hypothetical protein
MSPKVSAKVAQDALRIAIANAIAWARRRAKKLASSPVATGGNR